MMCHTTNTSRDPPHPTATETRRFIMRLIGLLVIVGRSRGRPAQVFHPRDVKLCQRGHHRGDRDRRTTQYFGANPKVTNCHVPQPS